MNLVDIVEDVLWEVAPSHVKWVFPAVALLVVAAAAILIAALA